jgi:hypothetical protein
MATWIVVCSGHQRYYINLDLVTCIVQDKNDKNTQKNVFYLVAHNRDFTVVQKDYPETYQRIERYLEEHLAK